MHYVSGLDVAEEITAEVVYLATSPKVSWLKVAGDQYTESCISFQNDRQILAVKCAGTIAAPAERVFELIRDVQASTKWDAVVKEATLIEEYDSLNEVVLFKCLVPAVSVPLYLSVFRAITLQPSKRTYTLAIRSIEHDKVTEIIGPNAVQADVYPSGWLITPASDDPCKCDVIYIQQIKSDPAHGNVYEPNFVQVYASTGGFSVSYFNCIRQIISREAHQTPPMMAVAHSMPREVRDSYFFMTASHGWTSVLKQDGVESMFKLTRQARLCASRGNWVSPLPSSTIIERLAEVFFNPVWDPYILSCTVVQQLDVNTRILYIKMRPQYPNIPESLCLLQHWSYHEWGGAFVWRSVAHECYADDVAAGGIVYMIDTSGFILHRTTQGSYVRWVQIMDMPKQVTWEEAFTKIFAARNLFQIATVKAAIKSCSEKPPLTWKRSSVSYEEYSENILKSAQKYANTVGTHQAPHSEQQPQQTQQHIPDDVLNRFGATMNLRVNKTKRATTTTNNTAIPTNTIPPTTTSTTTLQPTFTTILNNNPPVSTKRKSPPVENTLLNVNDVIIPTLPGKRCQRKPFVFLMMTANEPHKFRKLCTRLSSWSNSVFDTLPEELFEILFSFLDSRSLKYMQSVCVWFKEVLDNPLLWRNAFRRRWGDDIKGRLAKRWCGDESVETVLNNQFKSWKQVYLEKDMVDSNWENDRCRQLQVQAHSSSLKCVAMLNNRIVSGSSDKTSRIWDTNAGMCLYELHGNSGVVSIIINPRSGDDAVVRIGYHNGVVSNWSLAQGELLDELRTSPVVEGFMFIPNKTIAWGEHIEIWDETTHQNILTIQGHNKQIKTVVATTNNQNLLSGAKDNTIKMFDVLSGQCLSTFVGHTKVVNTIDIINETQFVSGSSDKTLRLWDTRNTNAPIRILLDYPGKVNAVKYEPVSKRILAVGDSGLLSWDTTHNRFKAVKRESWIDSTILCVSADEERVVFGGNNGVMRFCDYSSTH